MDLAGDTACTTRTEEDKQQVMHANHPLPSCLGPNRAHNINIQHCRTHYVMTIFGHRGTFHHHLFLKHQNINIHSTVPNTVYKYNPLLIVLYAICTTRLWSVCPITTLRPRSSNVDFDRIVFQVSLGRCGVVGGGWRVAWAVGGWRNTASRVHESGAARDSCGWRCSEGACCFCAAARACPSFAVRAV